MANIGKNIHVYLQTKSGVNSLTTRGYPSAREQGSALPSYIYRIIDSQHAAHLQGASGVAISRVQIDCYAATQIDANALAEAIRIELLRQPVPTMDSVGVDCVTHENGPIDFGPIKPEDGSDDWLYVTTDDYVLIHHEEIPG